MQFFLILLQILPYLPNLIKIVEQLYGPGNGAAKLNTAVSLISAVVPAVGQAIVSAPENQTRLETVIGATVAALNATGKMQEAPSAMPDSGA